MELTDKQIKSFQSVVWTYYRTHKRSMPWREHINPYRILVSEVMLQQTQVSRVEPKFSEFMTQFPTLESLAEAPLSQVLTIWSGLGYNRRAKYLYLAAQTIVRDYQGNVPENIESLMKLPGIGKNTAGAIVAYAYNLPVIFIETNIRTVYLHHFFSSKADVTDKQIDAVIEETLDKHNPKEWYWALMDYGNHLKQTTGNNISQSKHYTKQSTFAGSTRQLRGQILKTLVQSPTTCETLGAAIKDERLAQVITTLEQEGFIVQDEGFLRLR